jgi:hypothetical protein
MRRIAKLALLAASLVLSGCGGGGDSAPPPSPQPTVVATHFNVLPCLEQVAAPGATVANLVVPDTLKLDLGRPSGFPNGRRLTDPVIDITFAFLFVDLTKASPNVLANLPLNPSANDKPFRAEFPYLAPPQGNPPGLTPGGANYVFRNSPVGSYVQVDRMGMPAVATALIGSSAKTSYNDDLPATDARLKYVNEITNTLTALTDELEDDFLKLGIPLCAKGVS